ncbi:MAG: LiaI-LiaF-like domain-containing protein [Clostridia bacterium]
MIKRKVGSITLAVGLITVGALLFAQNFMDIPVKDIYKYWPVLLIGLGLEMVLYMVLYGRNNTEVKLSVDGLCIVFIIVLGLVSNGVKFINIDNPGHMFFGYHGNSIIDGVRYRTEISETYVKDNVSSSFNLKELKITNNFGDIKVLPTDAKSIRVEAKVTVKCNDEGKAREYAKDAVEIKEGEVTELSPKNPANWDKDDFAKAQVDFIVYVPKQVSVDADSSFGDIRVEGIDGKCVLENKNGEIKASDIGGDVVIDNSFGDIEVSNVGGKADISNKNGEITADKISGSAVVENHFGDITAIKIGGDLKITNNNGRITASDISGKADLGNAFGDINLDKINGGATVENKNGRIEAEDVAGNVQIKNSFGDIYFKSASINDGDIYAKTKFGNIDCEKPLQLNKEGQDTVAQGKLGTGQNRIELTTNNGNIDIE